MLNKLYRSVCIYEKNNTRKWYQYGIKDIEANEAHGDG